MECRLSHHIRTYITMLPLQYSFAKFNINKLKNTHEFSFNINFVFQFKLGNILFCPTNSGGNGQPTIMYQNNQPIIYNGTAQSVRSGLLADNLIFNLNPTSNSLDGTLTGQKLSSTMTSGGCQSMPVNESVHCNGVTNEKNNGNNRKSQPPKSRHVTNF